MGLCTVYGVVRCLGNYFFFMNIQEFCRVLFDAIEQSFEINDIYGVISDLYEGVGTDYVMCQECGYTSQHESKFYDLSLTVKNEFEKVTYKNS